MIDTSHRLSYARAMRRAFLVPVGLALAALGSRASAGGSTVAQATLEPDGSHVAPAAVRQPLLAISRARRGLAGVLAHSSHASHASHASHFSSSTPAPPAPTPVATQTTRFAATLNAAQEVPSVADRGIGAKGRFTATLQGRMLHWRLTFADLSSGERAVASAYRGAGRGWSFIRRRLPMLFIRPRRERWS